VTDAERYRPLHAAADRVVADLGGRYDVTVRPVELPPAVVDGWSGGVVRAVEIRPRRGEGLTVVVVWTGFPGVALRAGHAHHLIVPSCGCDACDEDVDLLVDDLAEALDALASGGLTETRQQRRLGRDRATIEVRTGDGWTRWSGTVEPGDELDAIPVGVHHWPPWPRL